jgi:hypothetical protein
MKAGAGSALVHTKRELGNIIFRAAPEPIIYTIIVYFKNLKFVSSAVGPLI